MQLSGLSNLLQAFIGYLWTVCNSIIAIRSNDHKLATTELYIPSVKHTIPHGNVQTPS